MNCSGSIHGEKLTAAADGAPEPTRGPPSAGNSAASDSAGSAAVCCWGCRRADARPRPSLYPSAGPPAPGNDLGPRCTPLLVGGPVGPRPAGRMPLAVGRRPRPRPAPLAGPPRPPPCRCSAMDATPSLTCCRQPHRGGVMGVGWGLQRSMRSGVWRQRNQRPQGRC